jgi:hypothetical protein
MTLQCLHGPDAIKMYSDTEWNINTYRNGAQIQAFVKRNFFFNILQSSADFGPMPKAPCFWSSPTRHVPLIHINITQYDKPIPVYWLIYSYWSAMTQHTGHSTNTSILQYLDTSSAPLRSSSWWKTGLKNCCGGKVDFGGKVEKMIHCTLFTTKNWIQAGRGHL